MISTNFKNSGKIMLYLLLIIGLVLGITAFILVLTKKCKQSTKEGYDLLSSLGKELKNDVDESKTKLCDKTSVQFCKVCLNAPRAIGAISRDAYRSCMKASNTYHDALDSCGGRRTCEVAAATAGLSKCVPIYKQNCT